MTLLLGPLERLKVGILQRQTRPFQATAQDAEGHGSGSYLRRFPAASALAAISAGSVSRTAARLLHSTVCYTLFCLRELGL